MAEDTIAWSIDNARTMELRVGDAVVVGGVEGVVTGICGDTAYPVKVRLNGGDRDTRPIWNSIWTAYKAKR